MVKMIRNKEIFRHILESKQFFFLRSNIDQEVKNILLEKYKGNRFLALFPMENEKKEIEDQVKKKALETNFEKFFSERPSLKEYFNKIEKYHDEYVEEFYDHIEEHKELLEQNFLGGKSFKQVVSISASGADSHNHSRQTLIVETDAGKFIYKPHSLRTDELIKEFCDKHFPNTFYIPKAADFKTYGFCEFVTSFQPEGKEQLQIYFYNMGLFCAVAYFLCISDLHYENFLTRGSAPVPVDLETPLTFHNIEDADIKYNGEFINEYLFSVYKTIMLAYGGDYFLGGLLCGPLNERIKITDGSAALMYKREIIDGFSAGYDICFEHKTEISELIKALGEAPQRLVIRNSADYANLVSNVFNVMLWDREDRFERLHKAMVTTAQYPEIGEAEYKAIRNCDIPYFWIYGGKTVLMDSDGPVMENYFNTSLVDKSLAHLEQTSESDKDFQLRILKKNLDIIPTFESQNKEVDMSEAAMDARTASNEIAHILDMLYKDAIRTRKGKMGFLTQEYGQYSYTPMGIGLSTGYCGLGIFSAACLYKHIGDAYKAKELLNTTFEELSLYVQRGEDKKDWEENYGTLGLIDGLGGVLRTLQLIKKYTGDERTDDLYSRAMTVLNRVDLSKVDEPNIYHGLAGLLIPIAHTYGDFPKTSTVSRIADRILELSFIDENGFRNWKDKDNISSITGYGKGIGGIGLAFLKAWEVTGNEKYLNVARNAIAFEDGAYSEEKKFWPHTTSAVGRKKSFPGICAGAPGLTFVMTEAMKQQLPLSEKNLDRVRKCVDGLGISNRDNLCCGNMAVVESLIVLKEYVRAGRILQAVSERTKRTGYYIHSDNKRKPYFSNNMLYGTIGVGYELLRYIDHDNIESLFV